MNYIRQKVRESIPQRKTSSKSHHSRLTEFKVYEKSRTKFVVTSMALFTLNKAGGYIRLNLHQQASCTDCFPKDSDILKTATSLKCFRATVILTNNK